MAIDADVEPLQSCWSPPPTVLVMAAFTIDITVLITCGKRLEGNKATCVRNADVTIPADIAGVDQRNSVRGRSTQVPTLTNQGITGHVEICRRGLDKTAVTTIDTAAGR